MIALISISIFGMFVADRIWIILKHSNFFHPNFRVNLFRTLSPLLSTILFLILPMSTGLRLLVTLLFCCLPVLIAVTNHAFRSGQRSIAVSRGLDLIILGMRSGSSLRTALVSVSQQIGPAQDYFQGLADMIKFKKPLRFDCPIETQVAQVLMEADQTQIRGIDKLKAVRDQLRMEQNFRQRSGQLSFQARTQAVVMIGLYLLGVLFGVNHFGWSSMQFWVLLTAFPFIGGVLWILNIGRGWKWKV